MEIMPLVLNRSRELENLEWRFLRQFAVEDEWHVKEPVWYRPPTPPPPPVGKDPTTGSMVSILKTAGRNWIRCLSCVIALEGRGAKMKSLGDTVRWINNRFSEIPGFIVRSTFSNVLLAV